MTGRDEGARAVHCANQEGREGGPRRSGPFVVRPRDRWAPFNKLDEIQAVRSTSSFIFYVFLCII